MYNEKDQEIYLLAWNDRSSNIQSAEVYDHANDKNNQKHRQIYILLHGVPWRIRFD